MSGAFADPILATRGGDRPAAVSETGVTTRDALRRAALAVARALPPFERDGPDEVVLVFDHDRFAFAAALLGTWAAGSVAVLPETARRVHVGPLVARPSVREILHDTGAGRGVEVSRLLAALPDAEEAGGDAVGEVPLRGGVRVGGSRWSADEVLARTDAAVAATRYREGEVVASTLAPTSWFGVVRGLLGPLRAGAVVRVGLPGDVEGIAASLDRRGAGVLVTCEAHRARLARLRPGPEGRPRRVVTEPSAEHPLVVELRAHAGIDDAWAAELSGRLLVAFVGAAAEGEVRAAIAGWRAAADDVPVDVARVDAIPRDANGRVRPGDGPALFGRAPDGRPWEFALAAESSGRTAGDDGRGASFRVDVPADSSLFAGHFPGVPILAASAQLDAIVLPCVRRARPDLGPLVGVIGAKFLERIEPGDAVVVQLRFGEERPHEVAFELVRRGRRATIGRARFAPSVGEDAS